VKPNFIIRTLFAVFFITLFCFSTPALAASSNEAAVNSYRKNLSRLRAEPVIDPDNFFEEQKVTRLTGKASPLQEDTAAPTPAPTIESPASDEASPLAKPSPYAVIAAARKPNQSPMMMIDSIKVTETSFVEAVKQVGPAIGRQVSGVSDRIHNLPNRIKTTVKTTVKTAVSNALDQAGAKAQQTAEQLRQL
jgi:hypothetical protein